MTILDRLHAPRPHGLSAMSLVLLIIALTALAHASPADPTWIAGIYEGADFDDVISLVIDTPVSIDNACSKLEIPRPSSVEVLSWGAPIRAGSVQLRPLRGPPRVFVFPWHWLRRSNRSPRSPSSLIHDCLPTPLDRSGEDGDTPCRRIGPRSRGSGSILSSGLLLRTHTLHGHSPSSRRRCAGGLPCLANPHTARVAVACEGALRPDRSKFLERQYRNCIRDEHGSPEDDGNARGRI